MGFNQKYTAADILAVMRSDRACTVSHIMKSVGCVRDTALLYLAELQATGKVAQVEIDGGNPVWIKVE